MEPKGEVLEECKGVFAYVCATLPPLILPSCEAMRASFEECKSRLNNDSTILAFEPFVDWLVSRPSFRLILLENAFLFAKSFFDNFQLGSQTVGPAGLLEKMVLHLIDIFMKFNERRPASWVVGQYCAHVSTTNF